MAETMPTPEITYVLRPAKYPPFIIRPPHRFRYYYLDIYDFDYNWSIDIFKSFFNMLKEAKTYVAIGNTILNLLLSLLVSFTIAIILAVLAYKFKVLYKILRPFMQIFRFIPIIIS